MAFVPSATHAPVRVLFSCTGLGIFNRGIESFFREAFDGLKDTPGFEARLIKGAGPEDGGRRAEGGERVVWCLPRTGRAATLVGRLTGRSSYAVEQWSSFPGVVREIRRWRPQVIYYSDANLGFLLYRWRSQIGVPFRLLYSNGGPCRPPFERRDFVHQVAPLYLKEALAAGEPPEKHFMIPYGIQVPDGAPVSVLAAKRILRGQLGLPLDRKIILSVGWIAAQHKRMDYVVREVARTYEVLKSGNAEKRKSEDITRKPQTALPFLQLLGAIDEASPEIVALGNRLLGPENFSARSVPYEQVADYYQVADVFVLGSLKEGFGRVYLEALMHGLPTIGHQHPVIEYVLGDAGITADLSQPGNLAAVLTNVLSDLRPPPSVLAASRRESVRTRFSWPVLAPRYREMFENCLSLPVSANPLAKP